MNTNRHQSKRDIKPRFQGLMFTSLDPLSPTDRDQRPEFKGELFTSTEPLDKEERLLLYRMNKAFDEFFSADTDQVIEERP